MLHVNARSQLASMLVAALTGGTALAESTLSTKADLVVLLEESAATGGVTPGRVAAMGDIDADGWGDIALTTQGWYGANGQESGRAWLLSGRTGETLRELNSTQVGFVDSLGVAGAATGDATGDGVRDLLLASIVGPPEGRIELRSGATGAIVWTWIAPADLRFSPFGASLAPMGDWDNDGVPEFESSSTVRLLPNGSSVHSGATGEVVAFFEGSATFAGDIDADGHPDALVMDGRGLRFVSGATLATIRSFDAPLAPLAPTAALVTGDLNGDSQPELIVCATHQTWVLDGVTGAVLRDIHPSDAIVLRLVPAGDADSDGFADTALSGTLGALPAVWVVSGRTGAVIRSIVHDQASVSGPVFNPSPYFVVGDADISHDGVPDIIARGFRIAQPPGHQGPAAFVFFGLPACAPDANYDRAVDFLDLNRLLSQFGLSGTAPNGLDADVNHDSVVDFLDLNLILSAYGSPCS